MILNAFKRYERKYMLSKEQADALLPVLREHMDYDLFCPGGQCYHVHDLYFDTAERSIVRACSFSPYFKEKLRLRAYSPLETPDDVCFLEYKKKVGKLGNKRRAQLTSAAAAAYFQTGARPAECDYITGVILDEIDTFLAGRHFLPCAQIEYPRLAFVGRDDPELRLTLDTNVRASVQLPDEEHSRPVTLIPRGRYLMEIKIPQSMPIWLSAKLTELGIYSVSHSKYGRAYALALQQKLLEQQTAVVAGSRRIPV